MSPEHDPDTEPSYLRVLQRVISELESADIAIRRVRRPFAMELRALMQRAADLARTELVDARKDLGGRR
jgi:hypothetical protein